MPPAGTEPVHPAADQLALVPEPRRPDAERAGSGPISNLSVDAFARSIAVNRDIPHVFFLGAGASVTSGVLSAAGCTWQWKRQIFLSNNVGLDQQFSDASIPSVQQKVQRWLDDQGSYPRQGAPDEYGFFAERCYPIPDDRRRFFQSLTEGKNPYIGYKVLALLAAAGIVRSIWTTNFDGLVPRALSDTSSTVIEVGLDTVRRLDRQASPGEILTVALHGDYRYDSLLNTSQELQRGDKEMRDALIAELRDKSLVVSGYSARDDSIMNALEQAYSQPGPGRLYWCGHDEPQPAERVQQLLRSASANGRQAFYVPTHGFDDLMLRIALQSLTGDLADRARALYSEAAAEGVEMAPFRVDVQRVTGLIKSNAFSVDCPSEVLQFEVDNLPTERVWRTLRDWTAGKDVAAVPQRGKTLALGTIDAVREVFSQIRGPIDRSPIAPQELARADGAVVSLLREALVRSLARIRGLGTNGRDLVWTPDSSRTLTIDGAAYRIHDAATLLLRHYGGRQYLVVMPTLQVFTSVGEQAPFAAAKEAKRQLLSRQWNRQFDEALTGWRNRLLPNGEETIEFPPDAGSTFRFTVSPTPAHARLSNPRLRWSLSVPADVAHATPHDGTEYDEPPLVFSNRRGDGYVPDPHPIRGIVRNQPFDFALTERGLVSGISVGVVCPKGDAPYLSGYLAHLHQSIQPDTKLEYLLPYPGFAQAFGVALDVASGGAGAWAECQEPATGTGVREGAAELGREITRSIDSLWASRAPSAVLVYIPERWESWEEFDFDGDRFNLHDFVKAYCVQKGIPTQLLRQRTLVKKHQCEVIWWLALSLYVKSMRTPWVLESLGPDVAFMGLGFSLQPTRPHGQQVIVGCSHLYSADGRGLRYRLSKLENPVLFGRNPFMSKDDARRMAENARQLFFESMDRFPRRVVIHKRTPFLRDETEGLREGLSGIETIDMLEVTVDPALRYIAEFVKDGVSRADGFPVKRGTAVVLDRRRALLWAHGSAPAVQQGKRYYQGKSRIPAPLVVTRHFGTSPLDVVAREILGLSKMNWNTFDMYSKLPATIDSSNTIARIGSLLERFGAASYDYRLFI
jgi:hypothetical protein